MATSSIFTNVKLETEEQWEAFLDAVEQAKAWAARQPKEAGEPLCRTLTGSEIKGMFSSAGEAA